MKLCKLEESVWEITLNIDFEGCSRVGYGSSFALLAREMKWKFGLDCEFFFRFSLYEILIPNLKQCIDIDNIIRIIRIIYIL